MLGMLFGLGSILGKILGHITSIHSMYTIIWNLPIPVLHMGEKAIMETLFKSKVTTIVREKGKEMIKRPVASAVLAFTWDNKILMVVQERGNFGSMLEVPAGKVDDGEESIDAGKRELEEETGFMGDGIEYIGEYFPSVGYSTEQIDCFLVRNARMEFAQRLDDGERIEIKTFRLEELEKMILDGEIKDSKTIMCLNFYKMRYPNGV